MLRFPAAGLSVGTWTGVAGSSTSAALVFVLDLFFLVARSEVRYASASSGLFDFSLVSRHILDMV
jgi:hypothetical protein